jgi:D-amino peptidase
VAVTVKRNAGWTAADSLHPARACEEIRQAAAEVVGDPNRFLPVEIPDRLVVDVRMHPNAASLASSIPGAEQTDAFGVRQEFSSPAELIGVVSIWSALAVKYMRD